MADGAGVPPAVTGANRHDISQLEAVPDFFQAELPDIFETPQHLCLDKGYSGEPALEIVVVRGFIPHKKNIGADEVKLLFNIVPEAAKYPADRDPESIAKTTVFNNRPDALCVSGITAGTAADTEMLKRVKDAVPNTVVLANTGVRYENVEQQLSIADGAMVGTAFKVVFENAADEERVKKFMDKVKSFRGEA